MKQKFCQSCAMPMQGTDLYATNADGTKNEDYCEYCYKDGAFTGDCTMMEMIEFCVPHVIEGTSLSEKDARELLNKQFPSLKRWQTSL